MRGFVFLVFLLLAGCFGARLVPLPGPQGGIVSQAADASQVRDAIARALRARRFAVEGEEPSVVFARLNHRGRVLRLRIRYDERSYQIEHLDSVGLGYGVDPQTQQPVISTRYTAYLSRLDRTIQSELGRPAREAQEAIEEEHERRLALQREETQRQVAIERARTQDRENARQAELDRERIRASAEEARADAAAAQVEAERLRRQPPPTFSNYDGAPVVVDRFAFRPAAVQSQSVTLNPGFMPDPYTLSGRASGRIASANLGLPNRCPGYWPRRPQHYVSLPQAMRYFRIDVQAGEDTTLAVVTPDGHVWCDDDGAGNFNPRLEGAFPAGTYAVYVGTYQRNRRTNYGLALSELPARQAAPVVVHHQQVQVPAPQQQQVPDCRQVVLGAGHAAHNLRYCEGAEPYCAQALMRAGHAPHNLRYCRGVEPRCAVTLIESGQAPHNLRHCPR